MAHVRSTARTCDVVGHAGGKGAAAEREASGEGHGSGDSVEWTESVPLSNVGSHSRARGDIDEGSGTQSYYFRPSTEIVSHIRWLTMAILPMA
jgi:hypothetical protein